MTIMGAFPIAKSHILDEVEVTEMKQLMILRSRHPLCLPQDVIGC